MHPASGIDSNVIAALWNDHDASNAKAMKMLWRALPQGALYVCAPVDAELMAGPLRTEALLNRFFSETGIFVDWEMEEAIWREAGAAHRDYAHRRKKSRIGQPRRILADFLIGAHALVRGFSLLTLDEGLYSMAFPKLRIISD